MRVGGVGEREKDRVPGGRVEGRCQACGEGGGERGRPLRDTSGRVGGLPYGYLAPRQDAADPSLPRPTVWIGLGWVRQAGG